MKQSSNNSEHPFLSTWKDLPSKEFKLSYQIRRQNGSWASKTTTIRAQAPELAITILSEIQKLEGNLIVGGVEFVK